MQPIRRTLLAAALLLAAAALVAVDRPAVAAAACGTTNAALNRPATASSSESASLGPAKAVDGSGSSRWSSAHGVDPQWIQIDLGATTQICQVVLTWQRSYATAYRIEVSADGVSGWSPVYSTTTGAGGTETLAVNGSGRYIRMYGTTRATQYGYSLYEFAVYAGDPGGPQLPGGGDLGSNVVVFDPGQSSATIQARLDQIFTQQEKNQFGDERYQLLFKPGSYSGLNAQLGFYTSISGLGQNPQDVQIHGDVTVDAGWMQGNATQNFWRSAENLSLYPVSGTDRWAVAQAAPFRRMDVHGGMTLASPNCGWASGGYIADSRVSGQISPCSQQQWFTRDSTIGSWKGALWNMVFSGVQGAPATSFPSPAITTLATSPVTQEKPYLYADASGYKVFVPSQRTNSSGATWINGQTPGTSLP
ncbi:discoidin domain-containing protein, partial [Dactylosporangium sp. NPDC049140]|uniref:discoidin domain-containing protein n=1 Tax=Dactylosporangium sp. NPDC049140 TaxID=3155647 RepID=UPI0033FD059D